MSRSVKVIASQSVKFFNWCFPSGINDWLIENDALVFYRGYHTEDFFNSSISQVSNDSLVLLYKV